ncbi:MAG: methyl-accepting chemotaxis protein [Desulfocapsaceae bacterium]|nr:methyl-accepting chemotaxis protein [Desulfocapsaceae bacterium]
MLKNLSVKIKLIILVSCAIIAIIGVGITGIYGMKTTGNGLTHIGHTLLPSTLGLGILNEAQTAIRLRVMEVAIYENDYQAQGKFSELLEKKKADWQSAEKGWKIYEPLPQTPEESVLWKQFVKEWEAWKAADTALTTTTLSLSKKNSEEEQKRLFLQFYKQYEEQVSLFIISEATLAKIIDINVNGGKETVKNADTVMATTRTTLITIGLLSAGALFILGFFIVTGITLPLERITSHMKAMAKGDFSNKLSTNDLQRGDEVGALFKAAETIPNIINNMINDIDGMVTAITSTSTDLAAVARQTASNVHDMSEKTMAISAASEEASTNSNSVAAGMEQATTNLSTVASATEEMSVTINEISENAARVRAISSEASEQADSVNTVMKELGVAANEIGQVTETITDISAQTNLLALNATIEAARAGEAGKGFAVVANEIKELARQTATATQDIRAKIDAIRASTTTAINDIERIAEVIRNVNEIVPQMAAAIEEQSVVTKDVAENIAQATAGVADSNENIAQTSAVSTEISRDIAEISASVAEIRTGSDRTLNNAAEMSALAEQLKVMISKFKV